jgi:agmatinase
MRGDLFFLESEAGRPKPGDSLFHVLPVPYEKTVSYIGGAAKGPGAILKASQQLELFDGKSVPASRGIYTHPDMDCSGSDIDTIIKIEQIVRSILLEEKIPVILGGEHTITYPAVTAALKHYKNLGVIQFDAHADLRENYDGSKYSHACVMKRIFDACIPFIQVGVRSMTEEEHRFREENRILHYDADYIYRNNKFTIDFPADFPDNIFITVDVDGLDPSVIPATGTPHPGGLLWHDFFRFIESIPPAKKIVGFDVTELAPVPESIVSDFAAAKLVYNIMGIISRRQ